MAARYLSLVLVHRAALDSRCHGLDAALGVAGSQLGHLVLQLLHQSLKLRDPAGLLLEQAVLVRLVAILLFQLIYCGLQEALLEVDLGFQFFCLFFVHLLLLLQIVNLSLQVLDFLGVALFLRLQLVDLCVQLLVLELQLLCLSLVAGLYLGDLQVKLLLLAL